MDYITKIETILICNNFRPNGIAWLGVGMKLVCQTRADDDRVTSVSQLISIASQQTRLLCVTKVEQNTGASWRLPQGGMLEMRILVASVCKRQSCAKSQLLQRNFMPGCFR